MGHAARMVTLANLIKKQFSANIFGHIELINLFIPHMRKLNEGKIIFANNINQILQDKLKNLRLNDKFLTQGRKLYLQWNI